MTPPDRLRALLAKPGFVVMPAVWDGLSAKLSAAAGFKTAFLSGSCVAASRLGGPDLDLISFAEMFDSFNMVRGAAPETLVLADGDHGYGNAMNVQRTVRAYGRAGAAAILIEDKITPRALTAAGKPCLPREEARMKIRAAVEAAKESGILVLARTDCRPTQGIDEAVARIEMYVKEGADILFLDSPADDGEIRRAVAAADGRPSFAVLSPGAPRATPSQKRGRRTGLQDRHLSDRAAVAGGGRHEGRAGGAAWPAKRRRRARCRRRSCARSWVMPTTTPRRSRFISVRGDPTAKADLARKPKAEFGSMKPCRSSTDKCTPTSATGRQTLGRLSAWAPEVTGDDMVAAMDASASTGRCWCRPTPCTGSTAATPSRYTRSIQRGSG